MTRNYISKKIQNCWDWISSRPYYIRRWYCRKRIRKKDFTIISNNCWAGKVYQYLNMPYLTPTVGLYFFADDYIKFVSDLRRYIKIELKFISIENSKHCEELKRRKQENVPIGLLDDVEIVFRHYKTSEEARKKWERRKKRINWNNLIIKFSRMNECTDEHLRLFSMLSYKNKFMFNISKKTTYKCEYYWDGPKNQKEILLDTIPFPGKIPIIRLLKH